MSQDHKPDVESVRQTFNEMAEEYDHLKDLWYSFSFAQIDSIIRRYFHLQEPLQDASRPLVVDVGCGTGIQSLIFAQLGYRIVGVDVAENLLEVAKAKLGSAFPHRAKFIRGDAQSLPLPDVVADVVNCCGPTISFVPDYRQAFAEMARVLKPGGRLVLECEQKWNLDMLWEVVSALLGNFFGYDESISEALRHFLPPFGKGHYVRYAFRTESGDKSYMLLKLFTPGELRAELREAGFKVEREFGIHIVTNLIPSTVLHDAAPRSWTRLTFRILSGIEELVYSFWPFYKLGCSLVVVATKT